MATSGLISNNCRNSPIDGSAGARGGWVIRGAGGWGPPLPLPLPGAVIGGGASRDGAGQSRGELLTKSMCS